MSIPETSPILHNDFTLLMLSSILYSIVIYLCNDQNEQQQQKQKIRYCRKNDKW